MRLEKDWNLCGSVYLCLFVSFPWPRDTGVISRDTLAPFGLILLLDTPYRWPRDTGVISRDTVASTLLPSWVLHLLGGRPSSLVARGLACHGFCMANANESLP